MRKSLILAGMLSIGYAYAQEGRVGINTENPSATLEVNPSVENAKETATTNEGIIAPKLSKVRIANIETPVEGTLVYATDATYTGSNDKVAKITEKGYYFYNGTEWVKAGNDIFTNTEPWYNAENNQPATDNIQRIYQMNKVGIGNKNPEWALDILGNGFYDSSVRLSRISDNILAPSVAVSKARGTLIKPTTVMEKDDLGGFTFFGYNNGTYKSAAGIVSVVDGPVNDDNVLPGALHFRTFGQGINYERNKYNSPYTRMVLSSEGYLGIGVLKPDIAVQVVGESYNRSTVSVSRISENGLGPGLLLVKGRGTQDAPTSVQNGNWLGGLSYAGYNGTEVQTAAAVVGKVDGDIVEGKAIAGELQFRVMNNEENYKNILDYSKFAKMVVKSSGNVGIGTINPTHILHIVSSADPLKLEGLQEGTGSTLVVDANGVIKKGSAASTSTTATNGVQNQSGMKCDATNAGKINYTTKTIDGEEKGIFGFCMQKGTEYVWGYMLGGSNLYGTSANGAAFGDGL